MNTRTRDLAILVYTATCLFSWMSCAAFRQHAKQARAATAAVIEAPQRVESGATVTEALGAALSAEIDKSDRIADWVESVQAGKITFNRQEDSWSQRLMVVGLVGIVALGVILDNRMDRRRYHRNGAEAKGIVR